MSSIKQWKIKEQPPKEFEDEFPEFFCITRNLLWQRGLKNQKDIDEFFNPDYSADLHDPLLLKNADKAVDRILQALEKREKIMVYGDYDSDGVCGATIIFNALKYIGFPSESLGIYMPDREKEGYGLNEGAVIQFVREKYDLIIAIDCGTTSHRAISLANENGLDVVVIDHHRVIDSPPPAYAFVNPHQEDDGYPFKDLCGAAVAFKIACALYSKRRSQCGVSDTPHWSNVGYRIPHIDEGQEKWFLDLVAMATITDVMPLLGENRTLVKYGLFVLAQAQRLGLKALMEISGVNPTFNQDSLTTNLKPWTLGFILGPRLNAAGRMDHANTAFALLNAETYEEALVFAREIDARNRERQELVERIIKEVKERLDSSGPRSAKGSQTPLSSFVIFEGDSSWSIGVAGLVAGKVAENYCKPAFIYQIKDNGTCAGSVRTIRGFHVVHALESVQDLLINFGGHPKAGGFSVAQDKLEEMKNRIEDFARANLKEEDFIKKIEYCSEIQPRDISWVTYEELERFEPFGEANREPVFLLRNASVVNIDMIGKSNGNGNGKKHLRLRLEFPESYKVKTKNSIKAMAFCMGERAQELTLGDSIDILFNFGVDEWNGSRELMLRIVDFRKSA